MPGDKSKSVITVTLRIRGGGVDDYGIARIEIPASSIDWSLADAPRHDIGLGDIYQLDLRVERSGEEARTDAWDRA